MSPFVHWIGCGSLVVDCIICCGIINSCQSADTSWSQVWLMWVLL